MDSKIIIRYGSGFGIVRTPRTNYTHYIHEYSKKILVYKKKRQQIYLITNGVL